MVQKSSTQKILYLCTCALIASIIYLCQYTNRQMTNLAGPFVGVLGVEFACPAVAFASWSEGAHIQGRWSSSWSFLYKRNPQANVTPTVHSDEWKLMSACLFLILINQKANPAEHFHIIKSSTLLSNQNIF